MSESYWPRYKSRSADHVRNALQLVIVADQRAATLTIPPDPELAGHLRGIEALLFKALFGMETDR